MLPAASILACSAAPAKARSRGSTAAAYGSRPPDVGALKTSPARFRSERLLARRVAAAAGPSAHSCTRLKPETVRRCALAGLHRLRQGYPKTKHRLSARVRAESAG